MAAAAARLPGAGGGGGGGGDVTSCQDRPIDRGFRRGRQNVRSAGQALWIRRHGNHGRGAEPEKHSSGNVNLEARMQLQNAIALTDYIFQGENGPHCGTVQDLVVFELSDEASSSSSSSGTKSVWRLYLILDMLHLLLGRMIPLERQASITAVAQHAFQASTHTIYFHTPVAKTIRLHKLGEHNYSL